MLPPSSKPASSVPAPAAAFSDAVFYGGSSRFTALLRKDSVGGLLLLFMAVAAMVWANSPWADSYLAIRDFRFGYAPWGLELSVGAWAADGLLAVFFFLVGVELKRELVSGDLRSFSTAAVPVVAAVGGVIVPAVIYLQLVQTSPGLADGWAVPTATDIAFALAVLAIVGTHLPKKLRIFLLTIAVVDDLIAIGIIAIFYTSSIALTPLLLSLLVVVIFAVIVSRAQWFFIRYRLAAWLILLPIGFVAWALMHASGVHATIAGVLLGLTIPVHFVSKRADTAVVPSLAVAFEHRFRPLVAGLVLPIFAFFAAGVPVGGWAALGMTLASPVAIAIICALVLGKPIGILGSTWLITRFRLFRLDQSIKWIDLISLALLTGIGFTVSLLIAELSFPAESAEYAAAKIAVLVGSLIAAALASVALSFRNRKYRLASIRQSKQDAAI